MAQANVGRLFIDLEARTARIEADLNKANQKLDQQTRRMKRTAERNMKAMTNVITGLIGLGIGRLIGSTINAADQIAKLSTRLGDSTEALSQYRLVAEKTGVEFKTLTTGIQRMTRRISEAAVTGKGEAVPALRELGLSAKALADLKPHEQFELLADAMMEIPRQGDRVRLAMKLFDTEGVALLQTMEGGSAAIRSLREEADKLGLTLGEDTAKQAEEFNDQLAEMKASLTGLIQTFIPIANKIVTGWALIIEAAGETANAIARIGRELNLLDGDDAQHRADRISQIHNEMAAKRELLGTLEIEVRKLTEISEKAKENNLQTQAGIEHLKKITAERNLAKNELRALQFELEKLTKEQEENDEQTKSNVRTLDDYRGITEKATDRTSNFRQELKRLQDQMRDSKVATDLFNSASEELDKHFEDLAKRAQNVIDRLNPLAALTRDYEEDVKALRDRFGDDEEGLTAELEKLDAEYEQNRKRMMQNTEELRRQEEQARDTAAAFMQLFAAIGSLNQTFGLGLTSQQGGAIASLLTAFAPGLSGPLAAFAPGAALGSSFGGTGTIIGGGLGALFGATGAGAGLIAGGLGTLTGGAFGGASLLAGAGAIAIPVIGALIGAGLGTLIASFFGGGGPPTSELVFGGLSQGGSPISLDTPFGGALLRGGGSDFRDQFQGPAADALARLFSDIGSVMTPEQIEAATSALSGRTFNINSQDIESGAFLVPIFDTIISAMEPVVQNFVNRFSDLETRLNALQAINVTMQALEVDPIQQFADAMERANETVLETFRRMGAELRVLGDDAFTSVEAMQRLGIGIQQYNQFIMSALATIENARRAVSASTSSTRDALILQTLDQSGQFNFLTRRAEQLAGGLIRANDPNQISSTVAQINQLVQQAFSIASPAQRQILLDQFLPFLTSVEDTAQARLDAIQAQIEQEAADNRAALQAIFDQGIASAQTTSQASNVIFDAANRFGDGVTGFNKGVNNLGVIVDAIDLISNEVVG